MSEYRTFKAILAAIFVALALVWLTTRCHGGDGVLDPLPERDYCEKRWYQRLHPCECFECPVDDEDEDSDMYVCEGVAGRFLVGKRWVECAANEPLSICDDCEKATEGGCDNRGGDCTDPECGTTRTESFTGRVDCIKDCADRSVHRVTCE